MKTITRLLTLALLVGCMLAPSMANAQTPAPQQCTNFDSFNLLNNPNPTLPSGAALPIGTVHGQDGWTPANLNGGWTVSDMWGYTISSGGWAPGLAYDENVVALPGGGQAWRMSNGRYFGFAFSASPFSQVLPDELVAGETGAYLYNAYGPDNTQPLGEPMNRGRVAQTKHFCSSLNFKSATGGPQPGLRLDVNVSAKQSPTRYLLVKLYDDTITGLTVDVYDMDLGVYRNVAANLPYGAWHSVKMDIVFVDGLNSDGSGNDIAKVSVDGGLPVVLSTWESYYAAYEPTRYPHAVDSLLFFPRAEVPSVLGQGFLFGSVCLSCPPPVITASADPNGTISPSGDVTVNYGDNQAFTITPATGYHIADVLVDGSSVGPVSSYTFTNVTDNHTIAASFAIDTFTVSASVPGGHGSVSPATQTVNYGGSASISITPGLGYHIATITDNGNPATIANPYLISNVTANHSVIVTFAINTFTVGASVSGGHGSVFPATQTVNYGGSASISITPDLGYHIATIKDNGNPATIANPYVISNVIANHTVVVTFAPTLPATKDQCKDDGWKNVRRADGSTFKNQGDCIQYVNTGK
jgi:hypothetical protein